MKVVSWIILGLVMLLGGYVAYLQITQSNVDKQVGVFSGTLPCADCEGLKTTLTLYEKASTSEPTTYLLEQAYVGKNVDPLIKKGKWAIQKGYPQDKNATIYVLNSDQPKSRQLYALKVNDNELKLLNQDQGQITSVLNFSLIRQK